MNVEYKSYNEFVLYGIDFNSDILQLFNQDLYYFYTAMTLDNGAEKPIDTPGDARELHRRHG